MDQAVACHRDVVNEQGSGAVWYVRLPDGYLLDCGCGYNCAGRAKEVTERLNRTYSADNT